MDKFTKPKVGEIRYLVFKNFANEYWIYKVKMIQCGRKWFRGEILKHLVGKTICPIGDDSGEYYYFCFVETLEDARKMLIYSVFDTRDVNLFYRDDPDLEQLV